MEMRTDDFGSGKATNRSINVDVDDPKLVRGMIERFGEDDPIVGGTRFQRLLRQANDANLIELVKTGEVTPADEGSPFVTVASCSGVNESWASTS